MTWEQRELLHALVSAEIIRQLKKMKLVNLIFDNSESGVPDGYSLTADADLNYDRFVLLKLVPHRTGIPNSWHIDFGQWVLPLTIGHKGRVTDVLNDSVRSIIGEVKTIHFNFNPSKENDPGEFSDLVVELADPVYRIV